MDAISPSPELNTNQRAAPPASANIGRRQDASIAAGVASAPLRDNDDGVDGEALIQTVGHGKPRAGKGSMDARPHPELSLSRGETAGVRASVNSILPSPPFSPDVWKSKTSLNSYSKDRKSTRLN